MKTHFKVSPEPLPEGKPYSMECGAKILHSRFNFRMEPGETWPESVNTIQLCSDCLRRSLDPLQLGSFYLYGVIEGEESRQGEGDAA